MTNQEAIETIQANYPPENYTLLREALDKAVNLLNEQEAIVPKRIDGKKNHFIKCGNCNYDLMTGFQFCPHCGRKVKWNE